MEWFVDYPKHYGLKPDDTGAEEAAFIRRILHLRKGQSVLDAPCGAGCVGVCLARAGIGVTGVDLTPSYIRRARKRFRNEGYRGTLLVADLREIDFTEQFDGAFNGKGASVSSARMTIWTCSETTPEAFVVAGAWPSTNRVANGF